MRSTLLRPITGLLGFVCLVLGVVGAFLPLMPSTVFFICAAACFAYASPRVEAWLLSFDFIGVPVRAWRERGAISRQAKIMASAGMTLGLTLYAFTKPSGWALAAAASVLALCAIFIWTRPE
jgi:uncharacterized protein